MKRKEQKECRTLLKAPLWQSRKGCCSTSLNVTEVVESDWKKGKEKRRHWPEKRISKVGAAKQGDHCHFGNGRSSGWCQRKKETIRRRQRNKNQQPDCEIETILNFSILTTVLDLWKLNLYPGFIEYVNVPQCNEHEWDYGLEDQLIKADW